MNPTKRGNKPKATQKCKICSSQIAGGMMRDHIGYHILHTPAAVTPEHPCGFCGGAEAAACGIVLTKDQSKKSYVAVKLASSCVFAPDLSTFSYKAAGNCSMKPHARMCRSLALRAIPQSGLIQCRSTGTRSTARKAISPCTSSRRLKSHLRRRHGSRQWAVRTSGSQRQW